MRVEQLKCFEDTTSVSLDQKLKKAQVQRFPNNTSLYKRIFQYVALVFLYGFFWPLSTVCYEGLYWSLKLSVGLFCSCLPADKKKKNIPRAQMISFPSQINVRCLSFKSRSRKARIYHLDLRKCLAFRLSSIAP